MKGANTRLGEMLSLAFGFNFWNESERASKPFRGFYVETFESVHWRLVQEFLMRIKWFIQ